MDVNGIDGHVMGGCVANTMSQIIKYWADTTGINPHYDYCWTSVNYRNNNEQRYPEQCADFENTNYQWNKMPNSLTTDTDAGVKLFVPNDITRTPVEINT